MTPIRAIVLAALALALWLTAGLASADEPTDPQTATRLHPGINLIGWVGEPTPVSQLFREIPQLEAVWTWDAEFDEWIAAARNAPEWLGGLSYVTAGMGLRMQLSGDAPVTWDRSTEPTRGLVRLRTGWNLVAWSGADGAPIENVAKGIGWSLRSIRRWDAATQQWAIWTSPERSAQVIADTGGSEKAETPGVRRGEALWVEVSRSVNWPQPTDILPRLVFPGGASQALQARVREDLEAVLSYYRDQYGIQANPNFTVYVAENVDALIQAYKDDGVEVDDAYEAAQRARWNSAGGWAGRWIVVKQSSWLDDLSTSEIAWARYFVTHEYFHILQRHLSGSGGRAATWLVEGTARWGENEHLVLDGQQTWEEQREWIQSGITNSAPTLRSTEHPNTTWQYALGWLATDLLTADAGTDSWVEFWRHLDSTEIGPHGRWTSSPDWRTAFQEVFGMPVADFYVRFASWQREQAQRNSATTTDSDDDARWIRGRVTRDGGAAVAGVIVTAVRVEGETSVGWNQRAETDATGAFAIRVFQEGDYRLSVSINDDCTRYYSNGELIDEREKPQTVEVVGSDLRGVDIQLPPNICGWQIRGHVVDSDGDSLAGAAVTACHLTSRNCSSERTESDGAFAVPAAEPGDYRLRLDLADGCAVYSRLSGVTPDQNAASLFQVGSTDVNDISIKVPLEICAQQISGRLVDSNNMPLSGVTVYICQLVDGNCKVWDGTGSPTDDDGSFARTLLSEGAYLLYVDLDGCSAYYRVGGLTTVRDEASPISVTEANSLNLRLRVPAEMCAHRILGRVLDASGAPLAKKWINVYDPGGSSSRGGWTDANGRFEFRVPSDGAYTVDIWLIIGACSHRFGGRSLGGPSRPIRVSGADVTGIEIRLPDTIENLCK